MSPSSRIASSHRKYGGAPHFSWQLFGIATGIIFRLLPENVTDLSDDPHKQVTKGILCWHN